jgi:hypothetical protein
MEQIQSVISRVDSSITTASESYISYMHSTTKETHTILLNQFHQQTEQINKNNDNEHKNFNVMFGDMEAIAENYNGIARNYDTSINGVVRELLENKITLARLTTQIDFIFTNMANNSDFLKNTGIWEDFVEHQAAFDRVQQELDKQYQRGGSTTTSTTQEHETKQEGERKKKPEQEYGEGKHITEQESRSNIRHDTATDTPRLHTAPATRQTKTTTESPHPQKNTDSIDLTISPENASPQGPSDNMNTLKGSSNIPSLQILVPPPRHHQPQQPHTLQASYAPGFYPLEAVFFHPSPDKTTTGLGRGCKETPLVRMTTDEAPQETPYPTKDDKTYETMSPIQSKKKQETCASCNTIAGPQNMTHCQNCYEPIHPQCAQTFRGYRLCLPCRRTNALEAAGETDNTSNSDTYMLVPKLE